MTYKQGIDALKTGNFETAISLLTAAIKTDPNNGQIYFYLAQALSADNRKGEAIVCFTHALAHDNTLLSAAKLLANLLSHLSLRDHSRINPAGLAASFCLKGIEHQVLVPTAIAYLKQCTGLGDAINIGEASNWTSSAKWLLSSKGRSVLCDKLLQTLLCTAANTDTEVEYILTALRKSLLFAPVGETLRKSHILNFTCALIRQVEINEYVFVVSLEEIQRLHDIYIDLEGVRGNSRKAMDNLMLKALYFPLKQLIGSEGKVIADLKIKPKVLGEIVQTHLAERQSEEDAANKIRATGIIEDEVSKSVASLYEKNPYPRWLSLYLPDLSSHRRQLAKYFSTQELAFMDHPFKVLIGGAGTGKQAIEAAHGYGHNAALTAIDISLSSLAYAKRMSNSFKIKNVKFVQCDILNCGLISDVFDVVECIGVLHHMDSPLIGWKALVEKLRPGGLMKIGLYSTYARKSIASLRDDIKARGLSSDDQTIRNYRQGIISEGETGKRAFLLNSADFYSLSNFRDLLFHVSEKHLSIPKIASFMTNNGLTFHGFQIPMDIAEGFPDDDDKSNLDQWHKFEVANPETFKGMYIFWCRKN